MSGRMIAMTGFSMIVVWQGGKNVLWFRSGFSKQCRCLPLHFPVELCKFKLSPQIMMAAGMGGN
jgi:hypothetical protein